MRRFSSGLHERCDVDAIDHDVLQFAADLDVDELDRANPGHCEARIIGITLGESTCERNHS
jgi:hypothetical protein